MSETTDSSRHSLKAALAAAALLGRGSDSMLAHISPREAKMLRESGGSGARNPVTGLLEFDGGGDNYVGMPQQTYGPNSASGLYAWGNSLGPASGGTFAGDAGPMSLAATGPSDFTPLASGASVPSYVSSDQGRATELAAQQSGGAGFDVGTPTIGTFNVNGQQNYGFQFGNGLFAPAFLPTSGEIPTSLDASSEGALYPAALAGETLQNKAGLPTAWTVGPDGSLVPTAQAQSDAAWNLPGEQRALADTGPSTLQQLLGVAGPIGMFAGGAFLGPLLGLGGEAAGAADAGASAAGLGASDLASALELGVDPAALGVGGAGAAAAAGGAVDLASLGLDPTTAGLLGIGGDVAVPGFSGGGSLLADAAGAAGGLSLPSLDSGEGIFTGLTSSEPASAVGGDLSLTSMPISAPSNLGAVGGDFGLGGADGSAGIIGSNTGAAADAGGSGWFSGITDPINKFVTDNSGLLKALGLGASALSLGKDLMGNNSPTSLTGGSQLNALAGQLAQPGGVNPTENANLASLEKTAQTVNQGQVGTLTDLQGQAKTSGDTLQSYLNTGTLPPAVQASVDQATQAAITSIKAGYAARGIPANSSMEIQDINTAKQNATAQAAQLMQSLSTEGLTEQQLAASIGGQITGANTQSTQLAGQIAQQLIGNGLSGAGISEAIYQTLLQSDQNQQAQTGNAIAALARALSGGTTLNLKPA